MNTSDLKAMMAWEVSDLIELQYETMATTLYRTKKFTVPIEDFAAQMGLSVAHDPTVNNGCIEATEVGYRIIVNPHMPVTRQRFTIAHELAHLYIHKDLLDTKGHLDRNEQTELEEFQANKVAAAFLMPQSLCQLYFDLHGMPKDENEIRAMAEAFTVSLKAMAIEIGKVHFLQQSQ